MNGRMMRLVSVFFCCFLFTGFVLADPTLDLTTAGSSGSIGSAFFQQVDPQSTGSGVISPFLTIQNNGLEKGYNTDADRAETGYDMKRMGTFTHSLELSDVPVVSLGDTAYRQFLLDINESDNKGALLSLDALKIYVDGSSSISQFASLSNPVYDLDSGANRWVGLNYGLNSGSGAGDLFVYVPDSLFSGSSSTPYVYLYSEFGGQGKEWDSSAGYEEWAVLKSHTTIQNPEPGSLILLASGIGGLGFLMLRKRKN
jgi:hypothetical protein